MYIYTYRDIYRYIGINRDNLIVLSCLPSSEKHLPAGNGNKSWDQQVNNVQRVKTSLLRGLSPSNPTSGAQDTLENRRQKDGKNQRRWRIPRTRSPSKHNRIDTHMNSQRQWQHAQGLHKFGTDRVSDMKKEVDTCPIPKPEAIFMNN